MSAFNSDTSSTGVSNSNNVAGVAMMYIVNSLKIAWKTHRREFSPRLARLTSEFARDFPRATRARVSAVQIHRAHVAWQTSQRERQADQQMF
jgi:hypothetical protein